MDYNPWIRPPLPTDIIQTFIHFSLLSWHMEITAPVAIALLVGLPIYLFVFGIVLFTEKRDIATSAKHFKDFEKLIFLFIYLFLPLAIALSISLKKPIYVPGRYDIIVFPAFCLIISFGLDKIKKINWKIFLVGGIIIVNVICLHNYYFIFRKSNDRVIADYVQSRMNKDDVLIFTNLSICAFRYYWKQDFSPNAFSFPVANYGWLPRAALEGERKYVSNAIENLKDKTHSFLKKDNCLWVMYSDMKINQQLIEEFRRHYQLVDIINFVPGRNNNQITDIYIFKKF